MRSEILVGALMTALAVPVAASGHTERPSYWPDPSPDESITPAAGGAVPEARSLASAVRGQRGRRGGRAAGEARRPAEDVRVVCKGRKGKRSLRRAKRSIRGARTNGFRIRPSQPKQTYSRKKARRMMKINRRLARMCRFHHVQPAIDASGNNDRVVVMPGTYREPQSRSQPGNDPRCNPSMLQQDASGDDAPSYEYQVTCPHDQNLIYVQGRALAGDPLVPPRDDRRGIPEQELGECLRCNLQIEGSGAKPTDVVLDAGEDYTGSGPEKKPGGHAKHVVLRADRTDGFVGRNFLMRGALEHGFYTEESDGVLLDRTKFFWNADYGHLSFTSDHHVVKNCDGMGAGDAAVYPGAAPETGSQATKEFWPDAPRANSVITRCDLRHSQLGYSGSMGNATRITENHVYGNSTGIASDTLSSAGHPGFPADGMEIDNNLIYANNFDIYDPNSAVEPLVTVPIGTGIIYAGYNDARVHDNWFFDNWRDAVMLFAVPDALTSYGGAEGDIFPGVSCTTSPGLSTSCGNHFFNNRMGQVPPGFSFPVGIDRYGNPNSPPGSPTMPNGNDFWWDEFTSNRWNCWFGNTGPDGTEGSITGPGEAGRMPASPPQTLPDCGGDGQDQDSSEGLGDPAKTQYLVDCSEGPDEDTGPTDCDWWQPPAQPGSDQGGGGLLGLRAAREFRRSPEAERLRERMQALAEGRDPLSP
jgi:hypothetical protein